LSVKAITHASLADMLLSAVRAQDFAATADSMAQGAAVKHFPSIDLAVAVFAPGAQPVWANVLFSRDFPRGMVADIAANGSAVRNVRWLADQIDTRRHSFVWWPQSDWASIKWQTLHSAGDERSAVRFVVPYPASLLKVMVAVGVGRLCDAGHAAWNESWWFQGQAKTLADWAESMIVASNNDATSALVALLHTRQLIVRATREQTNHLHTLFERLGLPTLRITNTRVDGRWTNGTAGVGQIHMTAWDTLRLLWLLRSDLPAAPWLASADSVLSEQSRKLFWQWMQDQALHEVLSSTALAGVPGWQRGIAARISPRWITPQGGLLVEGEPYPPDVRPANAQASALFLHKTGTTENYCSDAGFVMGDGARGRRYLVALITNLGTRYAPHSDCATTWRIPQLGAAIDAWIKQHVEGA
jgi:hypothetical protein